MQQNNEFEPGFGTHKFGKYFWTGAKPDPDELVSQLSERTSVSVFGTRRIGKSSLLAETRERLLKKGRNVVWVDLETNNSLAKILVTILNSLSEENKGVVMNYFNWLRGKNVVPSELKAKSIAIFTSKINSWSGSDTEKLEDALIEQIYLQFKNYEENHKPIIIFDELTTMLENIINSVDVGQQRMVVSKLNTFLGLLRNWRSDDIGVSMAICGSISMNWIQRKYGIKDSHINDCMLVSVEEMEQQDAIGLLEACITSKTPLNWKNECSGELLSILPAMYPGIIQLAYSVIKNEDASLEALKGPLRLKIESELKDKYYKQFTNLYIDYSDTDRTRIRRLFDNLSDDSSKQISYKSALKKLCMSETEEGMTPSEILLFELENDGFLKSHGIQDISFNSGLVWAWYRSLSVE